MSRRRGFAKGFAKDFAKDFAKGSESRKRQRTKTPMEKNAADGKRIIGDIVRGDFPKAISEGMKLQDRMNAQAKADESKSRRSTGKKNLN